MKLSDMQVEDTKVVEPLVEAWKQAWEEEWVVEITTSDSAEA